MRRGLCEFIYVMNPQRAVSDKKCVDKYLRGNYQVSIKEFSSVENMLSELPINKPSLMIVNLPEQNDKRPCDCTKTSGEKE